MNKTKKILKQILAFVLVFAMLAGVIPTGFANTVSVEAAESGRQVVNIGEGWKFKKSSVDNGQKKSTNDSGWETVNIPHCYNAEDGHDGNYYRGDAWYRKTLKWDNAYNDKRVVIEFLGANMQADVYVNETKMGTHKGGYTAFRYDITDKLKKGEDNLIAVKVNNKKTEDIAPLSADFTFYGGIYREVSLILTDTVHVDTMDYASSGLKLTTSDVSKESAKLNIKSTIKNDTNQSKKVKVKAVFKHPDKFEEVPGITPQFDVTTMYGGGDIQTFEQEFTINGGKTAEFSKDYTLKNPRLWNGLKDPYRYQVDLTVSVDGKVVDTVTEYVGFRFFKADYDKGFFLNGESYPLRGVCRHQDKAGKGNALTLEDHYEDFAMIYEIGANCVRLAHYPHAPYVYEICDKYGIVVWAEIPFVNYMGGKGTYKNPNNDRKSFFEVTKQQLVEMIRQNYNRPSIFFWGLQNEVKIVKNNNDEDAMKNFMKELNNLAHKEDPTGRLTTQATDKKEARDWDSDLVAWNKYPGWYSNTNLELGTIMDSEHKSDKRPFGISEYGSGSNVEQHMEVPEKNTGSFQSEEYANESHERYINDINNREYFWGTFLWNMFDFAAAGRGDGGLHGVNTKGIVTMDRKIKKDVFYLYKSLWTDTPVIYLTSRRYTEREKAKIRVSVYSNLDSVTLTMNGKTVGTLKQSDLAQKNVFVWENVDLTQSVNIAKVSGTKDGKTYTDEVTWKRKSGDATTIQSKTLRVNNTNKTIQLNKTVNVEDITKEITSDVNAYPSVYRYDNGKLYLVESGEIKSGMVLRVTSEDRTNNEYYTFVPKSFAAGKKVTASSEENKTGAVNVKEHAVDGDETTRWASNDSKFPQHIIIDLGEKKDIRKIDTTWFEKRSYKYKISVSDKENSGYKQVVDKTKNTTVGYIRDEVKASGRYVKIEVTGGSSSGNSSLYEVEVFGTDYQEYGVEGTRILEAENAESSGSAGVATADECSGGKYVGDIGKESGNKVTFKYTTAKAGKKSVDVYYMSQDKRDFKIKVNGGSEKTLSCKDGTDWVTPVKATIELEFKQGENTIEFGNKNNYAPNLDRIVIEGNATVDKDPEWPVNSEGSAEDDTIDEPCGGMVMHKVEAENGLLENGAYIYDSTGEHVVGIGGEKGGTATYSITCEQAGTRKLRIYYAHQFESKLKVVINGQETDLDCIRTGAFFDHGEMPLRMDIALNKGTNTIVFKGVDTEETPYIDFFQVELTDAEAMKTGDGKGTVTEPVEPPVDEGTGEDTDKNPETVKAELAAVVEAEKAIFEAGNTEYTEDSWNAFEEAYKAAAEPAEDATAETLIGLKEALETAKKNLKKVEEEPSHEEQVAAAKKALQADVDVYKELYDSEKAKYTEESWKAFADAYEKAKAVLEDAEADAATVTQCKADLSNAKNGLKKVPVTDSDDEEDKDVIATTGKLEETLKNFKGIFEDGKNKYTEKSWKEFERAYEAAEKALKDANTTVEVLIECLKNLTEAEHGLEKVKHDDSKPGKDDSDISDKTDDKTNTEVTDSSQQNNKPADENQIPQNTTKYADRVQVTVDKSTLYVGGDTGNTAAIKVILPDGAVSQKVTYKTSNTRVVAVDTKGRITARGTGNGTITVNLTLANGESKAYTIKIAVKKAYIEVMNVKSVRKGKRVTLNATAYGSSKPVTWKIKNGFRCAKITKKGKLTAKAKGKVKVVAKSGKISKTITIRIR